MTAGAVLRAGPWCDGAGRLSLLRCATLLLLLYPAGWMIWHWRSGTWLVPQGDLTYWSGVWATFVLLASLFVTPLRRILGWGRLVQVRRMVGVAALFYAVAHLVVFCWLRFWDLRAVLVETATRPSLVLATLSLLGLAVLGATSFDAAIRAMGAPGWRRLHAWVHPITILAITHFLLSPGSYGGLPYLALGAYLWLLGWRWLDRRGLGRRRRALAALGLGAAAATVLAEALGPALLLGLSPVDNLVLNLSLVLGLSPGWKVLIAALLLALAPGLARAPSRAAT